MVNDPFLALASTAKQAGIEDFLSGTKVVDLLDPLRPVTSPVNKHGTVEAKSVISPLSFKKRAEVLVPPRKVIPIIFVPGVMGSNLRVKTGREAPVKASYKEANETYTPKTWTPNEGGSMLWRMKLYPPALRQVILNKDNVEVDDEGAVDVTGLNLSAREAKERGWGEVMWDDAYGQIIRGLEQDLARFIYPPDITLGSGVPTQFTPWWKDMVFAGQPVPGLFGGPTTPARISPIPSNFKVTLDEILKTGSFRFPVHACGYNWLQSNADSAKRLKGKIEAIIKKYAEAKDPDGKPAFQCQQVIVVTHSMGGLVGRMAARLLKNEGNEDKILGIVQGEMPALGAPVMYRRMACGFESDWSIAGIGFARIVGATAAKANPVLAFSPGALQLAPTPDYPGPWLLADIKEKNRERQVLALPAKGDPYGEIFLAKGKWYCPAVEGLLDPAQQHKNKKSGLSTAWEDYTRTIKKARLFHKGAIDEFETKDEQEHFLGHYYHPNTYAHYGADPEIATFAVVRWRGEVPAFLKLGETPEFYQAAALKGSDGEERRWVELSYPDLEFKSQLEVARARQSNIPVVAVPNATQSFHCLMSHKGPDGSGDGTVPAASGVAPGQHGVSRIYKLHGFEHQGAYEHVAAQGATFFAIVDMVKRL